MASCRLLLWKVWMFELPIQPFQAQIMNSGCVHCTHAAIIILIVPSGHHSSSRSS